MSVNNIKVQNHWINKPVCNSQPDGPFLSEAIYWSTSPSDSENERCAFKRCKRDNFKNWVKPLRFSKHENNTTNTLPLNYCGSTNISPIIGRLNFEEQEKLSPILSQNNRPPSPIIHKKNYLSRIRSRHKNKRQQRNSECSDSIIPNSQVIEESPEFYLKTSQMTERIDPFLSQDRSLVSSVESSDPVHSVLYHNPPKHKRKYKKGGLAASLQKILKLQKTRFSIWQHEYEMDKICGVLNKNENILTFAVTNYWKEYGNKILDCEGYVSNEASNEGGNSHHVTSDHCTDNSSDRFNKMCNRYLILIGHNCPQNLRFEYDSRYKVYPPYNFGEVTYKAQKLVCYFNVTKIIPMNIL